MSDGNVDGIDAMARFSGLSRDEIQQIWLDVKANHARLNGCAYHEFEAVPDCPPLKQKYRCRHCGGEVDAIAYSWHEDGRRPRPAS